jgi:ribosomal protein S18 acetylase RimI-like enzyme
MELKKATITDIIDLKKICVDAYSLNFYDHWNAGGLKWYLNKEFSTERLTLGLTDKNTEYYYIEHKLKAVGFIKIRNNSSTTLPVENNMEVEKIYILPDYKGMGIGKISLNEIIKRTKERGCKNLFLCVIDSNENAISFYKKLGFQIHSTTSLDIPYFKEELKGMYRMVKELKQ